MRPAAYTILFVPLWVAASWAFPAAPVLAGQDRSGGEAPRTKPNQSSRLPFGLKPAVESRDHTGDHVAAVAPSPQVGEKAEAPALEEARPAVGLSKPRGDEPIKLNRAVPLPPRGVARPKRSAPTRSFLLVVGSLALVIALFLLVVWITRRTMPRASALLPKEVVQVLGRAMLAGRQRMYLIRVGNKLLLVSLTPTGTETLTEITDPVEVDRLLGICQQGESGSVTETFRHVFSQLGKEPAAGFLEEGRHGELEHTAPGQRRADATSEDADVQYRD